MEDFVTISQAAKIKRLSTGHIRRLCIDGKLQGAMKLGCQWIIPKKVLMEYKPGARGFELYWEKQRTNQKAFNEKCQEAGNIGQALIIDESFANEFYALLNPAKTIRGRLKDDK